MSTSDLIGKTIGQYQIVEQIGLGGMATIFKAYQPSIDRYVALKILPRHLANDPNFVKRFQHEARAIAALEHPHILPVHDFGTDGGYTYMVMRYVKGGTLADLMGKSLPYERIIQIIRNVAKALDYAHSKGVVHRDIKPSNILIDKHESELLTDFGIAKMVEDSGGTQLTSAGSILGTPAYMAPEQAAGKPVDGRTDIYSLGVVLYELLAGKPPYQAETPLAVVLKHLNDPLPPPRSIKSDIPDPLERVVLKAMAKNPNDRYQSAADMEQALKVALREIEVNAPTAKVPIPASRTAQVPTQSPAPKSGKKGVLTPILFIGGLLVVLLCLVGGGILTWALLRDPVDYDSVTPTTVSVTLPEEATPVPTATSAPALPTFTPAPTAPAGDSLPTPAISAADLDFFDDFSSNQRGWFEGDNSDEYGDYQAEIVDGRYRLSQEAAKSVFSWELPEESDFNDFVMSIDVTPVQFNEAFAYGVIFRVVDNEKFYAFEVDTDGYFFINLYQNGDWETLVDFTQSDAVLTGNNTNHLVIMAMGPMLTFFINDQEVITIEDSTLSGGSIGVAFELYDEGNSATVDFDNLKINALDEEAIDAESASPAAGEILFAEYFDSDVNGWATGYSEDELTTDDVSIVDGRYRMNVTALDKAYVEKILPDQDFSDFALSLEATPLDAEEHYSYGLAFREDEFSLSAYTFEIGNDGLYSVQLYDGEWQVLQDWTYTDAINVGETNELRVIANGNILTFMVNGQELTTIEDGTLSSGTVALVVDMFEADQSATVDFDNLIISTLE